MVFWCCGAYVQDGVKDDVKEVIVDILSEL